MMVCLLWEEVTLQQWKWTMEINIEERSGRGRSKKIWTDRIENDKNIVGIRKEEVGAEPYWGVGSTSYN